MFKSKPPYRRIAAGLGLLMAAAAVLVPHLGVGAATTNTLLNFSNIPLFLGQTTKSNVIMAIDNSGSMNFETTLNSSNGMFFWNDASSTCSSSSLRISFVGCGSNSTGTGDAVASNPATLNINPTGGSGFEQYAFLFPNGTSGNESRIAYSDNAGYYALPPVSTLAFTRSPAYNQAYFDPTQTYAPWQKYDQTSYANATPSAALYDPSVSGSMTIDLTQDVADKAAVSPSATCASISATASSSDGNANWGFRVFSGMVIPSGTCVLTKITSTTTQTITRTSNGSCSSTSSCGNGQAGQANIPIDAYSISCSGYSSKHKTYSSCSWKVDTTTTSTTTSVNPAWAQADQNVTVGGSGSSDQVLSSNSASTIASNSTVYIRYFPATFWLDHGTASPYSSYTATPLSGLSPGGSVMDGYQIKSANFTDQTEYQTAIQNFANWFSYYRRRILALKNGMAAAFNSLGTPLRLANFPINPSSGSYSNLTMLDSSVSGDLQTFYSSFMGLVANSGTPNRNAVRWIGSQYRRTDSSAPINSVCQKNFGILFTDGYSDPLSGSVSAYSSVNSGNVDGSSSATYTAFGANSAPYSDNVSYSMADETMYDYVGPLRNDGQYASQHSVPASPSCSDASPDPTLDCNTQLHMDFYGVILNTVGLVYDGSADAVSNAYTSPPTWPSTSALGNQSPSQVDELFHAALNGRGKLLNATSPEDIAAQLRSVISEITAQTGSGSSIALNTTSVQTGSAVYAARFYNADWSGQLQRYSIVTSGTSLGQLNASPDWDAQPLLDAATPNDRVILTYSNSAYSGVAFRYSSLDQTEKDLIGTNPVTSTADAYGSLRVDYVRGVRTNEATNANPRFRTRGHVLGDIIDSSPFYVGAPAGVGGAYNDASYSSFATAHASRTPMVYVGANDGTLHGFKATSAASGGGTEVFAYVPSKTFGSENSDGSSRLAALANLTSTNFVHQYLVDGSPTVADAQIGDTWKSVLVGTLGQGGQGVFALDVTDPNDGTFTEANAASKVLWEFTDADDPDLGYTFSQPSIVKLANGKWAAIIGNGYNNTDTRGGADTTYSTTNAGKAVLFILLLSGPTGTNNTGSRWQLGTDYYKIYAGSGTTTAPNGLATPAVVDVDGDGVADYVYAGDLLGNLWRFNLNSSSPSAWKVAYNGNPVFVAKDTTGSTEAITERPEVGYDLLASNPTNSAQPTLTVYFGTGRYIDQSDTATSGQKTQTFYAIFDRFDDLADSTLTAPKVPPTRDSNGGGIYNMVQQTIIGEATAAGAACSDGSDCFRLTSNNPVSDSNQGWYIDLINTGASSPDNGGERQVTAPTLRNGRIIFTTLVPGANACSGGGGGWLMELSATTGSRLTSSPFDVNHNGQVDTDGSDNITYTVNGVTGSLGASGERSSIGILSMPAIVHVSDGSERKYLGGSKGSVAVVVESASGRNGRITWREVTP